MPLISATCAKREMAKLHILICRAAAPSEPEPDTGKYLTVFETSRLLEYLPLAVDAGLLEHTSPWKHYAVFTQDQIIDVIASKEPVIYQ